MKRSATKRLAAARDLHAKFPTILDDFHQVLKRHGMNDLRIDSVDFHAAPSASVSAGGCPPGTVATTRCVPKPGGGVFCFTVCEPSASPGEG